ncbi:MAG: DUF2723 domain-containing protein [Verrucomicrobia bacterium]|nr:DUF2723 domain-containing protein [Verrucomicrobiota bacterium]
MSAAKTKSPTAKGSTPTPTPSVPPPTGLAESKALYRPIDWLTLAATTLIVMAGYMLTLAPDLTLEDSGELAVASLYAGIPHPPGYPVWTLYTWLFANLIPFSNIAWRVGVGSAFAGALSCGLIGLMVSRGSSMIIEGVAGLKNIERRVENLICIISGFVAGGLLGFNGFMWSQSVIVEVYSLSVLSLVGVLACLLRWVYTPHRRRYLYWAFFIFGICFTNHQTLILAAMGIEVTIALADHKLGRNFFLWNSIFYLAGLVLKAAGVIFTNTSPAIFTMFHVVGVLSLGAYLWLAVVTRESFKEFCRDGALLLAALLISASKTQFGNAGLLLGLGALAGFFYLAFQTQDDGWGWLVAVACGALWFFGISFYLYMALAGATNPPMQWGYPRIVEGFWHALTRGQYEKANPTNILEDPLRFLTQLQIVAEGITGEFSWVLPLLAIVPFLFLWRMQKRERAWILGLLAMYVCMALLLVILLNPSADRASRDLTKVFFTASHVFIAMFIGYGLTLIAALGIAHHERIRQWLPVAAPFLGVTALDTFLSVIFGMYGLGVASEGIRSIVYAVICVATAALLLRRHEAGKNGVLIAAGTLAAIGLGVGLKGVFAMAAFKVSLGACVRVVLEGIAYTLSHGDVTLQVYGGALIVVLTGAAVLLLWRKLEGKRLTLLLAAFAAIPAYSALSHWFGNEQRGHLFGYWFGHDMFTPPFTAPDGSLSYDRQLREELSRDPEQAQRIYPEMTRDAVLFGGTDPGRFCPTYMIFCESFIPPRCKPLDPAYDRRDVYIITQNALADGTYLHYIRAHYNKSEQRKYDTPFFQEFLRSKEERELNYRTNALAKLAYRVLDQPLLNIGERIEANRRARGVYPPKEIYIPSPRDSSQCFEEYLKDAQARLQQGRLKPGEDVRMVENRVQVSGQVAVMAINGLLTKVIFDNNPNNEFFVEESFPLDWMYPHLTPFGVIMKINRQPLATLSEEVLARDHHFWREFSKRLIGDWIDYDTPVEEIARFAEKTYLRHDFDGFQGDRKFVRDDQAQKAFSKLRSSIAGVYAWRLTPEAQSRGFGPQTAAEQQRLIRETDFALRQAFAYCPYSPEAVFRYVNLLMMQGRYKDAHVVAETCLKLDPYNPQVADLVSRLGEIQNQQTQVQELNANLAALQQQWNASPTNLMLGLNLAANLVNLRQTNAAITTLDRVLAATNIDAGAVLACAQAFLQLNNFPKLEAALQKLTVVTPDSPEAWYDLGALQATLGKPDEAIQSLKRSLALSDARLEKTPTAKNLRAEAVGDLRLGSLRGRPELDSLLTPR